MSLESCLLAAFNAVGVDVKALQAALATKVDKVAGKQLSTEDYTSAEKSKLGGIAAGAQVNAVTSVAGKTGAVALTKGDVGLGSVDNTSDANKPVSTATQAALDLKANLASPVLTGTPTAPTAASTTNTTQIATTAFVQAVNSADTGSAATAVKLKTARTINGMAFDGSDNITVGEPTFANPLSGHAASDANALNTGGFNVRYLTSSATSKPLGTDHAVMTLNYNAVWSGQQAFDWRTGDIFTRTQMDGAWLDWATQVDTRNYAKTIPTFSVNGVGLVPARVGSTTTKFLREDGTWVVPTNTTYAEMSATEANTGTATTAQLITAAVLKGAIQTHAPTPTSVTGNAGTATKLATARNLTIGATAKAFDGSATVSWSLAEIGAADASHTHSEYASASHTHSYLPMTGGILTGTLTSARVVSRAAGNDYHISSFEATGDGGSILPGYGFHQPGGFAGILQQNNGSTFSFYTQGRASYADLQVGALYASGNVTAFSDRRLKKDLVEIDGALAKVKQLTGYTYTRIDTGERQTGLVAQDVQKVLPEAIKDNGEYLSVAYGNLVGLLVNSIKELEQRVAELEKKVGGI